MKIWIVYYDNECDWCEEESYHLSEAGAIIKKKELDAKDDAAAYRHVREQEVLP
jgi:hypothetical protein